MDKINGKLEEVMPEMTAATIAKLKRCDITRMRHLAAMTEGDLIEFKYLGNREVQEVKKHMQSLGINFKAPKIKREIIREEGVAKEKMVGPKVKGARITTTQDGFKQYNFGLYSIVDRYDGMEDDDFLIKSKKGKIVTSVITCQKGDIFYADMEFIPGTKHATRPVIAMQCAGRNVTKGKVIVINMTSTMPLFSLDDGSILLYPSKENGLSKKSLVLPEEIRTIEVERLLDKIGKVDEDSMIKINKQLSKILGISLI